jgi:DNA-binding NarL/FixJ family response regulator
MRGQLIQGTHLRVRAQAADAVARAGLQRLVRAVPGLVLVGPDRSADVLVVVLDVLVAQLAPAPLPAVLIVAEITADGLRHLAGEQPVAVLPRATLTVSKLAASVRAAVAGEPGLLDEAFAHLSAPPEPRTGGPAFTDREVELLRLVAQGVRTGEIAQRLHLSERTVKMTVATMKSRLGLRNRTHAVAEAIRSGRI